MCSFFTHLFPKGTFPPYFRRRPAINSPCALGGWSIRFFLDGFHHPDGGSTRAPIHYWVKCPTPGLPNTRHAVISSVAPREMVRGADRGSLRCSVNLSRAVLPSTKNIFGDLIQVIFKHRRVDRLHPFYG